MEEYLNGIDSLDGIFDSSTQGNMTVLIDYTDSPLINKFIKQLNSKHEKKYNKFVIHELEILLGGNQVIPPSQTICKITGELGNSRKFRDDQMFYVIKDVLCYL